MTSVLLERGSDGVDGVSLSTCHDFGPIAAAGYQWNSQYAGYTYGTHSYAIEASWAAGLPVMPNVEAEPDAAKGGYARGQQMAEKAIVDLTRLGFLGECPVPFSAADKTFTDMHGAGLDYHRALVDVLGGHGWIGGAYGMKAMMELLPQQSWWPADWPIWHWGGDGYFLYDWAWAKQWYGHKPQNMPPPLDVTHDASGIPFTIDENTLLKPMRFWSGYGPDRPPDPPEVDMELFVYQCNDADAAFLGLSNATGIVPWVEWLSGGRKAQYLADGLAVKQAMVGSFANCTLIGALPQGDSRHTWVASDFAQTSGTGPKGDPGKDAPTPKSFTPVY